jgi:hypothetical protein
MMMAQMSMLRCSNEVANLALGFLFALDHVRLAFRFRQRKIDGRTRDAGQSNFANKSVLRGSVLVRLIV